MTFRRLAALVTSVACVAGLQPGLYAGVLAAADRALNSDVPQAQGAPISGQSISGKVLQADRKTTVPNHAVQLRNLDKGTVVGRTVTDSNGAFSFAVTEPGSYVVEAVKGGGIVAAGNPVTLRNLPISTNVILPLRAVVSSTIFAIAAGAGILGWVVAGEGPTSPER